jgi:hypothetical protein
MRQSEDGHGILKDAIGSKSLRMVTSRGTKEVKGIIRTWGSAFSIGIMALRIGGSFLGKQIHTHKKLGAHYKSRKTSSTLRGPLNSKKAFIRDLVGSDRRFEGLIGTSISFVSINE